MERLGAEGRCLTVQRNSDEPVGNGKEMRCLEGHCYGKAKDGAKSQRNRGGPT